MSTYRPSLITQGLVDVIDATGLVLEAFYGDPPTISKMPCAAVEMQVVNRAIARVAQPPRLEATFNLEVYVYFSKLGNREMARKETDVLLEDLIEAVEQNPTIGGLVIWSHVSQITPAGTVMKNESFIKAGYFTVAGRSLTTQGQST